MMSPERHRKAARIMEKKNDKGEPMFYFMPFDVLGVKGFYATATTMAGVNWTLQGQVASYRTTTAHFPGGEHSPIPDMEKFTGIQWC
jgi:hypothetical protein